MAVKTLKKTITLPLVPDAGTTYKSGEPVSFSVKYPADLKPDSVVYLMDGTRIGSSKDSTAIILKTDTLILGARVITAKVYQAGQPQEFTTNIVLLAAKSPKN
jgi:hypothetical protein